MLFSSQTFLAGATILSSLFTLSSAKESAVEIKFDKCVTECVAGAGCAWNDPKCMCTSAQDALLDLVAACLYYHCQPELRQFDATFLNVLVDGCKDLGKPIPKEDIKAGRDSADLFLQKLPPQPTKTMVTKPAAAVSSTAKVVVAATSVVENEGGQKQQTTLASMTRTSAVAAEPTETETEGETSSNVEELPTAINTPEIEATPTAQQTTLDLATGSPTVLGAFGATTATKGAPSTEATDSSPFAVPDSGVSRRGVASWALTGLPLVAALLVR